MGQKKYTKEQLVKGMTKYYQKCIETPEAFEYNIEDCEQGAIETIDYLLNIIDDENKN